MFSKVSLLLTVALAAVTLSMPATQSSRVTSRSGYEPWHSGHESTRPAPQSKPVASKCNTGPQQCCNSLRPASNETVSSLLSKFGIPLYSLDTLFGLDCFPILAGGSCVSQSACCEDNDYNGAINVDCTEINV